MASPLFEAQRARLNRELAQDMGLDATVRGIIEVAGAAGFSGETMLGDVSMDGENVVVQLLSDKNSWLVEMTPDQAAAFVGGFKTGEQSRKQGRRTW